jgi:hypothetical protein
MYFSHVRHQGDVLGLPWIFICPSGCQKHPEKVTPEIIAQKRLLDVTRGMMYRGFSSGCPSGRMQIKYILKR